MTKNYLKSLLYVFACVFCVFTANAAVSLFSDYGQIQNVQNYSSNPFWSPTAPYNQRLPQPVYATGADLNSEDCIKVVQSLVSAQCLARDNCKNTDLSDIRPTIMVQLSNLPGANYVSSCSGYLDGIFESYKQQYGNALPNRPTAFPDATVPNPDVNDTGGIKFDNPYKSQPAKWQIEQKERADELQRLQAQNGVGKEHLVKTDFPATYADLSFSERMENDRAGLMPYKDTTAYRTINVKSESEWCREHPESSECKTQNTSQNTNQPNNQNTYQQDNSENITQNSGNDNVIIKPDPEKGMVYLKIQMNGYKSGKCFNFCPKGYRDQISMTLWEHGLFKDGFTRVCADITGELHYLSDIDKKFNGRQKDLFKTEKTNVEKLVKLLREQQNLYDCKPGSLNNKSRYIQIIDEQTNTPIETIYLYGYHE